MDGGKITNDIKKGRRLTMVGAPENRIIALRSPDAPG